MSLPDTYVWYRFTRIGQGVHTGAKLTVKSIHLMELLSAAAVQD